jgi:hypothetical protein
MLVSSLGDRTDKIRQDREADHFLIRRKSLPRFVLINAPGSWSLGKPHLRADHKIPVAMPTYRYRSLSLLSALVIIRHSRCES